MAFISGRPYQLIVVSNVIIEYISVILCHIQAPSVESCYSSKHWMYLGSVL